MPRGATFDPVTRIFQWIPAESQESGSYRVTFSVSDGWAIDSEDIVITVLDPHPWQNRSNPADVDGNGRVSPLDVLVLINRINRFGAGLLQAHQPGDPYCDVNGDGDVGPIDSLLVINYLNARPEAEGESGYSEAVDPFRAGTLGQILPGGTAGTDAIPADAPGTVASSSPTATWDPYASTRDLAVGADKAFEPGAEPEEDLLTVLAARSRSDWWAAADDLFSDAGWFGRSLNRLR